MTPGIDAATYLAGSTFMDAYSVTVGEAGLDARKAAMRMFARMPRWASVLLAIRDGIVAPLGLKTACSISAPAAIGFFPIVSETPDRLVLGIDDRHLDFRVIVDISPRSEGSRITATTIVRTHNRLGRFYLAAILPFQRLILRTILTRAGG